MTTIQKNLNRESIPYSILSQVRGGRIWDRRQTFIAKDPAGNLRFIELNLCEKIWGYMSRCSVENYLKKTNRISQLLPENELNLLIYNASRFLKKSENQALKKVESEIEKEKPLWRGNKTINLPHPIPFLSGEQNRKDWWGLSSRIIGSPGFLIEINQLNLKPGIALDLGCGTSDTAIDLLKKGWKVICVDYSPGIIETLKARMQDEQIDLKQASFACENIENYVFPSRVDLVIASSSLPYCDPEKIPEVLHKINCCLKPDGYFIGNFFAHKYSPNLVKEVSREMGSWFIQDEESVGHLIASQGFHLLDCRHSGRRDLFSVVFVGKKAAS